MWIRQVLVPGYTDKEEDLLNLKKFLSGLKTVKKLKGCFLGRQYIVKEQDLKLFISKLGVKNEN